MQKDFSGRFAEYFNPRSREGSDSADIKSIKYCHISIHAPAKGATCILDADGERDSISIHAPAKGATSTSIRRGRLYRISIHAPAKGATEFIDKREQPQRFQSTLPRRERQQYFTNPQINIVKY